MTSNNTMKLKLLFATLTTIALVTPVAANAEPVVESIHIDPSSPEAGEDFTVSLTADAPTDVNDLMEAEIKIGSRGANISCSNPYTCDEASHTFNLDEGDYTAEVRVRDLDHETSEWKTKSITVDGTDGGYYGSDYEITNVGSTKFRLSAGESAQLQADVKNNIDYSSELEIRWFAERGGDYTRVASSSEWVSANSEETLAQRVTWYEFQRKIDTGKRYDLKARLYSSGEKIDERDGGYIFLEESEDLAIDSASAEHKGDGRVKFRLEFNQDVGNFNCRVSENDRITTYDSPVLEKVSGSDSVFEGSGYFKEGSYSRYLGCLNEDNEKATDPEKLSFEVRDGDIGFKDAGPTGTVGSKDVRLFVELEQNPDTGWCKWEEGYSADTDSDTMAKPDPDTARWIEDHSFDEGTHRVTYQCFDHDGEITEEKTVKFTVDISDRPEIELKQPEDGEKDVSTTPRFKWEINDEDDSRMDDVKLYIERYDFQGDRPWNSPEVKVDVDTGEGFTETHNLDQNLQHDTTYIWGIEADGGDSTQRSEVYRFTTGERDEPEPDREGDLTVTVRDGDNHRLENAYVRVKNGDYETDRTNSQGVSRFYNLEDDWYDVRVRCDGETETDRVHVDSGEDESITIRMDKDSSDNYCDDQDDEGPTASFTLSDSTPEVGQSVRFDASGSNGDIMEYRWAFPDGTTKYGTSVYKSFDSAGQKKVQLRVTEYDYQQSTISKTLNVQRRDDDDGDGDDEEREDPIARLDIDPRSAEIGEQVEFDAADSEDDGDIEEYLFDIDGDGDWDVESSDGDVHRTFFEEFDGEARVKIIDNDGNSDIADENYEIRSRPKVYLSDMEAPRQVCNGESFDVTLDVRNPSDDERFVVLEGRGFGDTVRHTVVVDEDETERATVSFTAGEAGSRSILISARNSNDLRRSIEVLDCSDPSDVSGLSVSVMPETISAGDSVKVSGYVENARGREDIRILLDGRTVTETTTQPDGYYQVYVYPEEVGGTNVVARSGDMTARTQLMVEPTVGISSMTVSDSVFQGESFEICGNIESQVDPLVVLYRNGEKIGSTTGNGEVCFTTSSSTAGETTYRVGAYARGASDSISRQVEIMETKPETTSFPEKIASVESGDGIVKATIYNSHREVRRYQIGMSGLPGTWTSTTEKEVILQPGEEREVFFYLTPQREGRHQADISISSGGSVIYEESVPVITGGTNKPQKRSLLWRLRNAFQQW